LVIVSGGCQSTHSEPSDDIQSTSLHRTFDGELVSTLVHQAVNWWEFTVLSTVSLLAAWWPNINTTAERQYRLADSVSDSGWHKHNC